MDCASRINRIFLDTSATKERIIRQEERIANPCPQRSLYHQCLGLYLNL